MGCLNIKQSAKNVKPKFYIEKTEASTSNQEYFYRNHFRVYYVVKGYVTIFCDEGERRRLGYGDISIIPPNVRHTVCVNTANTELYSFTFSIDFVENILQNQAGTSGVLSAIFNNMKLIVIAPVPAEMQLHLNHIMDFMSYECSGKSGGTELVLRNAFATVLCIFLELLQKQQSEQSLSEKNGIIYAISYVKANYSDSLTPCDVAAKANMSVKNFISGFKRFSGHTFHDFLNKVRIEKAVEILKSESGEISFLELSDILGYDNYITFYRNFIKYTGLSPAKFAELPKE